MEQTTAVPAATWPTPIDRNIKTTLCIRQCFHLTSAIISKHTEDMRAGIEAVLPDVTQERDRYFKSNERALYTKIQTGPFGRSFVGTQSTLTRYAIIM